MSFSRWCQRQERFPATLLTPSCASNEDIIDCRRKRRRRFLNPVRKPNNAPVAYRYIYKDRAPNKGHTPRLTDKYGRGSTYGTTPRFDCFLEPVDNLLRIQGKLLRISNLLFILKYFPRTLFSALPPPTQSSVAQTTHA